MVIIDEYREYLEANGYSQSTVTSYTLYADKIEITKINQITKFVSNYRQTRSGNSTNSMLDALKNYARFAHQRGYINEMALKQIISFRRVRKVVEVQDRMAYSIEEGRAIIAAAKLRWQKQMFWFLMSFGLRIGELVRLQLHDVDLVEKVVRIRKETSKGLIDRFIPILDDQITEIEKWLTFRRVTKINSSYYLVTSRGDPISELTGFTVLYRSIEKKVNVRVMAHNCRYTFATRLWEYTGDIFLVQKMLGHQSPETTVKYLRLKETDLQNIYYKKAGGIVFV